MSLIRKLFVRYEKFRYALVGGLATVCNFAVASMLALAGVPLPLASTIGFLAGGQVSFWGHRGVSFKGAATDKRLHRFALFMANNVTLASLNGVLLLAVLHLPLGNSTVGELRYGDRYAFIVVLAVVVIISFCWNKYVVFSEERPKWIAAIQVYCYRLRLIINRLLRSRNDRRKE